MTSGRKDIRDVELSPEQAGRAQARLNGFSVHVKSCEGGWHADVVGMLLLPDGRGKRTPDFMARAADEGQAALLAIAACRRAYAPRSVVMPPHAPKAG